MLEDIHESVHTDKNASGSLASPEGIWHFLTKCNEFFKGPHEYFFLVLALRDHRRRQGVDSGLMAELRPTDLCNGHVINAVSGTKPRRLNVAAMEDQEGELAPLLEVGIQGIPRS